MSPDNPLRIALTPGDPAGIGPDLCLQLAQTPQLHELVVIADPELLTARAATLQLPFIPRPFDSTATPAPTGAAELCVLPVASDIPAVCGQANPANARYVLDTLDRAVGGCQDGTFTAMVTGPVNKALINAAGIPFSGHTEYLAAATGTEHVVMLLATEGLRVALATTHVPLREVSDLITAVRLERVLRILHTALQQDFAIDRPRIIVCGLNPHAGESGNLGHKEDDTIIPLLERLRGEGFELAGPLPADTVFTRDRLQQADAVLAMYHDQGLPVLKHMGFGNAVNVTLGLPIIRTSVDHGTAYELAGTGRAGVGSLVAAIDMAIEIAGNHAANR